MLLLSKSTIIGHVCGQLSAPSHQYFIVISRLFALYVMNSCSSPFKLLLVIGVTLNMGELNDAYLLILKRYHVEVDETTNYRKHLKQLITEHLQMPSSLNRFAKTNLTTLFSQKQLARLWKFGLGLHC